MLSVLTLSHCAGAAVAGQLLGRPPLELRGLPGAGEIQAPMDVVDAPQFSRRHVVGKCRLCLMHKIPELLCLWFKTDDFSNRNQAAETKRWG